MSGMTTSPTELLDAIKATLSAHFGTTVKQVADYWPLDEVSETPVPALETPALLLRLERQEREDTADPMNRLILRVSLALYAVLSLRTERLYVELAELSGEVLRLLAQPVNVSQRGQDWGLGYAVQPPEAITDDEGDLVAGPNGTDSRVVRWEQLIALDPTLTPRGPA